MLVHELRRTKSAIFIAAKYKKSNFQYLSLLKETFFVFTKKKQLKYKKQTKNPDA